MTEEFLDYELPKNAYANFDASSLKNFIIQRLNTAGVFTDQNFEGSNLAMINDIIAYSYHTLLFYLNNTSNESLFSEAQLYENINRIVKLINYKPSGFQTSLLSYDATSTLNKGTYVIPRYSFFNINGVAYSFGGDVTFSKSVDGNEELTDFSNAYVLYQGIFRRNDDYFPVGETNEIIELQSPLNKEIDSNNIFVYIKRDGVWNEWQKVDSLFLVGNESLSYEVRYNERGNYDIYFGDDINGSKLVSTDLVSIYYLESDGEDGQVDSNFLNTTITLYSGPRIDEILEDINDTTYISIANSQNITFTNSRSSSQVSVGENVDDIRKNASNFYKSQNRLVSAIDYETFIKNNYNGIIASTKVLSNDEFLNQHIKYLSDIGISNPFEESRILNSQLLYSNSSNFNNVYVYVVPRMDQKFSTTERLNYIQASLKQNMLSKMNDIKTLGQSIIIQDPVLVGVDIAINKLNEDSNLDDINDTTLRVYKSSASIDNGFIINAIFDIFNVYFKASNLELGQNINLLEINNQILNINGVTRIETVNGDRVYEGLNLYVWNPIYTSDLISISQNLQLENFKFPFFYDLPNLKNKIEVITNA